MTIVYATLSAMMFAATFVTVRIGVKKTGTLATIVLSLTVNVIILWSWTLIVNGLPEFDWLSWRYFIVAGLFAPLLGRTFQFLGMSRLGANLTTPITLTHPLVTMLLAVIFLGEVLSWLGWTGALLIVTGTLILSTQKDAVKLLANTVSNSGWSFLLPIIAALSYGISVVFRGVGISAGSDPITASALTTTISWILIVIYILISSKWLELITPGREMRYIIAAGIFSSLGPVFMFSALQLGSIVVVAPLATTTPLFVMIAMYFLSRETELFTLRVMIGTLATIVGVILITLST